MTIRTIYILTTLILACGLLGYTISNAPISKFTLIIRTYNHAEQMYDGITTYKLTKNTLTIYRKFMFSDAEKILFSKKIDTNSIRKIKSIRLDNLKTSYFNNCIMATSGNEYFISTTSGTIKKKISLHHYYVKEIESLINELNKKIPNNLKLDYVTSETEQDCE